MSEFEEGIYDQLVTRRVREAVDRQTGRGLKASIADLEEADGPDYLARHLVRELKVALGSLSGEDRKQRQIEFANSLLEFLRARQVDLVEPAGEILRALYRGASAPVPPLTPLGATMLRTNAKDEPKLGSELELEMATADRVLMVVSFIQWRGWQRLREAFLRLCDRQAPVRILTTTYIGATEFPAIEELAKLPNVELRISLDGLRNRLHAKASCLVLDFIGNHRQVEGGVTRLPGNCQSRLDRETRKVVLENLKSQLHSSRARMVREARLLAAQLGRRPTLTEYLADTLYNLNDVYKDSVGGWYSLLQEADLWPERLTEEHRMLLKQSDKLLHVDSPRRLRLFDDREADARDARFPPAE